MYGSLWACETISGLEQGYWIVSWDMEIVFKILISWILANFFIVCYFQTFSIFLCFFEFNDRYWPTKFLRQKMILNFFITKLKTFLNFAFFSCFLYDLFIDKVRKLEVAVSNPIMEDIPVSFSLHRLGFLSFFFPFRFYLSLFLLMLHISCCYVA